MKKKKSRVLFIVIIIIVAVCAIIFIVSANIEKSLNELSNIKISDIDLNKVSDGAYDGTYSTGLVSAEVKVTVNGHKITDIQIVNHDNGKGKAAESITGSVIKEQTLKVDTVSGATHSSKVILLAIENALKKGAK